MGIYSFACSCNTLSVRKALKKSDIIFTGKVISVEKRDLVNSFTKDNGSEAKFEYHLYDYTFEVTQIFKGKKETITITITTTGDEGDCSGFYEMDREYLMYVFRQDYIPYLNPNEKVTPFWTTNICLGTDLLKGVEEKDLAILEKYARRR